MVSMLMALLMAAAPAERPTVVDAGVLRWQDDRSEVALFGVNYYPPFAIDYTQLKVLGLDHRQVIEQDLLHLSRLGLNCLRLHCWDREISDRAGNLLDNEHLALLDYLIAAAKRHGLYTMLTPIAWWGTANPSPGFSTFFGMDRMTTDAGEPRAAQRRYLAQFVQHTNRYTQRSYADDPAVLAFEMINEPIYPAGTTDEQVTAYIDALADAVRATGCRKPLFYSYFCNRLTAVGRSRIDGITFGWYPTGLVAGRMLTEDYLGRVDDFADMRQPALASKVKAVYEFDAADVGSSYMYPAMARAFRSGGAQWACQFQYDAWPLARTNVNWMTHFLSLPFAPGKAMSFLIAGEAFRRLPRHFPAGRHPESDRFAEFQVSYQQGLSQMVGQREYFHSGDTTTPAKNAAALQRVYGVGSSPVVAYEGTGAYFLDQEAPGVWRLEVYPDVVWVADPHGHPSLNREVSRVRWLSRAMTVRLPDLGEGFSAAALDAGNQFRPTVAGARVTVRPGVYRLCRAGQTAPAGGKAPYFAPPEEPGRPTLVWHDPAPTTLAGDDLPIRATCTDDAADLTVWYRTDGGWQQRRLERHGAFRYEGVVPAAALTPGRLEYAVAMTREGRTTTFPGALAGAPDRLAAVAPETIWSARALAAPPAAQLHETPGEQVTTRLVDGVLRIAATAFSQRQGSCLSCSFPVTGRPAGERTALRLRLRAGEPATNAVEVILSCADGKQYDTVQSIGQRWREVNVPLLNWKPRGATPPGTIDPATVRQVTLVFGTWLYGAAASRPHAVELAQIDLAPPLSTWAVPIEAVGPPVSLLQAAEASKRGVQHVGGRLMLVSGPADQDAIELSCSGFGPPPDAFGVTCPLPIQAPVRRAAMARCERLRLKVRGLTPASTGLEVVLSEADGSAWGTTVVVPPDWGDVEVPVAQLRYFGHWHKVPGRGGQGDRVRPDQVVSWHLTIGPWLNPEHGRGPWRVQVSELALDR